MASPSIYPKVKKLFCKSWKILLLVQSAELAASNQYLGSSETGSRAQNFHQERKQQKIIQISVAVPKQNIKNLGHSPTK